MQQFRDQYHNSVFYLLLLALGTLVAFWPTYFSIFREAPAHAHACRAPHALRRRIATTH